MSLLLERKVLLVPVRAIIQSMGPLERERRRERQADTRGPNETLAAASGRLWSKEAQRHRQRTKRQSCSLPIALGTFPSASTVFRRITRT